MSDDKAPAPVAASGGSQPHIGIVIPVFGHSGLVAEAIASAINQDYDGRIDIVVVIDGDRDPATVKTVRSFLATPARSVSAIFRPNGRLPAARNTGIRYLLARFSTLHAIYLLDADNRLSSDSIQVFVDALAADPNASWAYPDVTFFGMSWGYSGVDVRETAPTYSRLRHRMGNICEAGSMVRADVFRSGILYDETFTRGYEDWEYWLQCAAKGHYGTRADNSGFLYRRRADSMLADADRVSNSIKDGIYRKHAALFDEAALWDLFREEFRPLMTAGRDATLVMSDTDHAEPVTAADIEAMVLHAHEDFHHAYLPRLILYPLTADAGALTITLPLLKNLMRIRESRTVHYLDGAGNISEERIEGAAFGIIQFRTVLYGTEWQDELTATPAFDAIRDAIGKARSMPRLAHFERRYSGPVSYRVDRFMEGGEKFEIAPEAETLVPPQTRGLVVSGSKGSGFVALMARLGEHFAITEINLDSLAGTTSLDPGTTIYNGVRLDYRKDEPIYKFIGEIAPIFEAVFIVDDTSYLFHSGQWKGAAKELVFLASGELTGDQRLMLQAVDHSLAKIVAPADEVARLSALGIPARKLESLDTYLPPRAVVAAPPAPRKRFFSR